MIKKINKKKIITIVILILCLMILSIIFPISFDEIWNFGFSYNTSKGLLPYIDFNMVTLPFYQLIMSLILKIFGKKIIIYNLFMSLFISLILANVNLKNLLNCICIIFLMLPMQYAGGFLFGYNTFILILFILCVYLEKKDYKYKEEVIGIIVGMSLMTKINLGIFILIPYFIFSKHKLKSLVWVSIIPLIILIYLLATHSLSNCIDYCFLGLNNFKNNMIIKYEILFIELILIIYLIYKYIKSKDKIFIYLLFWQGSLYPILELNHFILSIIPIIYYLINLYGKNKQIVLCYRIVSIGILIISLSSISSFHLHKNNDFLQFQNIPKLYEDTFNQMKMFQNENKDKKIFFFSYFSYGFKLYSNQKITKYDFILSGNMGSDEEKNIKEINSMCQESNKCLFLINPYEIKASDSQLSKKHISYVLDNYKLCNNFNSFNVYCNYN